MFLISIWQNFNLTFSIHIFLLTFFLLFRLYPQLIRFFFLFTRNIKKFCIVHKSSFKMRIRKCQKHNTLKTFEEFDIFPRLTHAPHLYRLFSYTTHYIRIEACYSFTYVQNEARRHFMPSRRKCNRTPLLLYSFFFLQYQPHILVFNNFFVRWLDNWLPNIYSRCEMNTIWCVHWW